MITLKKYLCFERLISAFRECILMATTNQALSQPATTANSNFLSFSDYSIESYDATQDRQGAATILNNGSTLRLVGNTWKKIALPVAITANTILQFDFKSTARGETHAIGFDTDNIADTNRVFMLYGTERQGFRNFNNYSTIARVVKSYEIAVGKFFTGTMNYLTFINDHDVSNPTAESIYSNLRIFEKLALTNDTVGVNEDVPLTLAVANCLANDIGTALSLRSVANAVNGNVTLNQGTIVFTPNPNFNGNASFTYSVIDRDGKTAQATVNVTVNPVNDLPIATNDNATTNQGTPLMIPISTLLSNDRDGDGDLLRLVSVSNAARGQVSLDGQGNVIFTPEANYAGNASFQYTLQDPSNASASANVAVVVNSVNKVPVATYDTATAIINTPITLLASTLLANDADPDGDSISLNGVRNALHGSVNLASDGKVTFTPETGFTGNASFEYTITDGRGGTGAGTVDVKVQRPLLGTNLNGIADWSTQLPFLDGFKSSRAWFWDGPGYTPITTNLDANGWLTSVTPPNSSISSAATLLYRELGNGQYPAGCYVVLYDGQGSLDYRFDARKDVAASRPGRDILDVTPSDGGILLKITSSDPNNYIRNIRVLPLAQENSTALFNPTFISRVQPYQAFRFMDWMQTNNSTQVSWSDRPTLDDASWSVKGAPVEVMVALANQTDRDPWFTIPHQADNNYIANFAQYVKNNLEPERKVYVEYSNEAWNWMFQQTPWIDQKARAEGLGNGIQWFGKRTAEVIDIWENAFGDRKDRIVGVLGAQAANPWTAQEALDSIRTSQNRSPVAAGIDAVAIAPYFGHYLGAPETSAEVQGWTTEADGGLTKLFDELLTGGVLSSSPAGGALKQASNSIESYSTLARQENLQLLAYEGGQHLAGYSGVENNTAITNLFGQANRDPRMGEIYKQYLNNWYQRGGGLFMNFNDVGTYSKWGSWGSMENLNDTNSPKYKALLDVLQPVPTSV